MRKYSRRSRNVRRRNSRNKRSITKKRRKISRSYRRRNSRSSATKKKSRRRRNRKRVLRGGAGSKTFPASSLPSPPSTELMVSLDAKREDIMSLMEKNQLMAALKLDWPNTRFVLSNMVETSDELDTLISLMESDPKEFLVQMYERNEKLVSDEVTSEVSEVFSKIIAEVKSKLKNTALWQNVLDTVKEGRIADGGTADDGYRIGDLTRGAAARARRERVAAGGVDKYQFGDFTKFTKKLFQ